jgi:hypothetical protein
MQFLTFFLQLQKGVKTNKERSLQEGLPSISQNDSTGFPLVRSV